MFAWIPGYELIFGAPEEDTTDTSSMHARVTPTSATSPKNSVQNTRAGQYTNNEILIPESSTLLDYSGARSIVMAAVLENLTNDEIDLIIEQHENETGSSDELAIEELEKLGKFGF